MKWFLPLQSTILCLLLAPPVAAQEVATPPTWTLNVGTVAVATPRYPGSAEHRVLPFPMLQMIYQDRVYFGPSDTGMGVAIGDWVMHSPRLSVAVELGVQDSRPAGRADALAGMEDRPLATTGGLSLRYRSGPFQITLGASHGLNDGGGALGSARVVTTQRVATRLIATGGVGAIVADARQMRREFGITPDEATRRGTLIAAGDDRLDPAAGGSYRPQAGLRSFSGSLTLVYLASSRWSVVSFGGLDRLASTAARSPLVLQRLQLSGGAGLSFRLY